MCSIFGTTIKDIEKLEKIAIAGEQRGTDATGIASINDNKFGILKAPKKASELDYSQIEEGNFYLGHTRKTTQGNEDKNYNNHPFVSKDETLIFAHNGVFSNDDELKTYETQIETDSFYALQQIEKAKGESSLTIENVKTACEKMSGSFALTIYDVTVDKLFLLRHRNPLQIMYNPETGDLTYASLTNMIRAGYGKETDIGTFIGQIEEDIIYEFDMKERKFKNQLEFSAKKRETYKGTSYYRNYSTQGYDENKDEFDLKNLQGVYFSSYSVYSSNYNSGSYNYEQCDFCGIHYRDDNWIKAGKEEEGKHICAYCWEEEKNTSYKNHIINDSTIERIKKWKEKKGLNKNELAEIDEMMNTFALDETQYLQLPKDKQKDFTFCSKCKLYYNNNYELMEYDEQSRTYICDYCASEDEVMEYIESKAI